MKIAPFLSVATAAMSLLWVSRVEAATFGEFTYTDNGETITIDDYPTTSIGEAGTLTIPATIMGKPVVEIDWYAFSDCVGLRQIIVPEGVITLGAGAFHGCLGLSSIQLPSTLTKIEGSAFSGCISLSSITIPAGVTAIENNTFDGCQTLSSVSLSPNTVFIENSAFYSCANLSQINFPASLVSIGSNAFYNCDALSSVVLAKGLTTLGGSAFAGCDNLVKVSLPDTLLVIPGGAFSSCDKLNDVELGNGVVSIGDWAFSGCDALESITIPASVSNIQDYAFSSDYGYNINTVRFLGNAPVIGNYVFDASGLVIEYYSGATGFTTPSWNGYFTREISASPEIDVEQPQGTALQSGVTTVDFGSASTGATVKKTFVIRNSGVSDLKNLSISITGTHAVSFTAAPLPSTTLAPGATLSVTVTFRPQFAGVLSAKLSIASNDPDENPFEINLKGTGGSSSKGPEIAVESPKGTSLADGYTPLAFGTSAINVPVSKTVTIRNVGTSNLTGLAVKRDGTHAANYAVSPLNTLVLTPGSSTSFKVTFTPSAAGLRSAMLKIVSNDGNESPFNIPLSGSGFNPKAPEITVLQGTGADKNLRDNQASRNFGRVQVGSTSTAMTFTIRNDGTAWLKNVSISFKGTYAKDFIVVKAPALSVAPGKSTQFKVSYKPLGSRLSSATMKITSNDANENPFRVALSGYGTRY